MKSIDYNLKNITKLAAALLIILSGSQVIAQKKGLVENREQAEGWYLPVFGQVFENGEKCEGATVKVYLDNDELGTFPVTKKGSFRLEFDLNRYYTIEIAKPGLVTKRIAVNTNMDEKIVNYPAYDCFVNLMPADDITENDRDYLDFPAAIVRYNDEMGGFYHSEQYMAHMAGKFDDSVQQANK